MKRNQGMIGLALVILFLSILFQTGCAKKTFISGGPLLADEKISAQSQAAPDVLTKDGKSVPKEGGTALERPLRTEALREEGLAGGYADRPVTEKDRATQLMLAKESSSKEALSKEGTGRETDAASALKDVHFDFDKYSLGSEDREILKGHADWLSKHGDYMVTIEGHCDERGTTEYNLALGERRAEEAKRFLVDLGVDEVRIKTISYGKELPLDPGHDEQAWAKNRRAHFTVTLKK
jgi:peptidoglycan-associated lipoprotein